MTSFAAEFSIPFAAFLNEECGHSFPVQVCESTDECFDYHAPFFAEEAPGEPLAQPLPPDWDCEPPADWDEPEPDWEPDLSDADILRLR